MKSAKNKSPVSVSLEQELVDARNRMQSRATWELGGRAEVRDAAQMHKTQRCTNTMQAAGAKMKSSKAMYCSSVQDAWIQKSKSSRG